ncbi:MAG: POTRA domain-containing protein, partial [Hyphomicrobiaceae bacterium]
MPQHKKTWLGGWRYALWLALAVPALLAVDVAARSAPAHAQGVIRSIQVVGNRRLEPETVRSYLQFSVGDSYSAGAANRSLRALFATGLFSDVRIDREGTTVVVNVVENPVVSQVAFE